MDCKIIKDRLVNFIENKVSQEQYVEINKHLETCDSCKSDFIEMKELLGVLSSEPVELPSENLRKNFEQVLYQEKQQSRVVRFAPPFTSNKFLKYAAGFALLLSTFLFGRYQQTQKFDERVSELRSENLSNKQAVMLALMENESASKRIQGVQYIEEFSNPDPEIVKALVKRMLYDENTNVRLTAVNALEAFISSEAVKDGFIKALETEKDPAIQISIIKSLVKIQEKKALKPMQKLLEQDETQSFIKDEIKTVLTNNI
ncbi:MAG: HEAT repeat domain-containing protein [Flavobacteriaceae bacterium]|nr:HEAT repeat domain-containing protein [Flavobacteriaceae bacterium]